VVALGDQGGDDAVRRGLMLLDRSGELADLILQLPAGRVEGVADGDVGILVPPGHGRIAGDIDVLATRDCNVDADAIGVALVVAMLGASNDHPRRCDAIVEALDLLCLFAHGRFQCVGMADVLEGDLEGYLHELILLHVAQSTGPARIPPELYEYARIERIDAIEADLLNRVAEEILQAAATRARGQGAKLVRTSVSVGDPAQAIVAVAKAEEADLITMGRRGLGSATGLLMGSVSNKVAHLAECVCMTVV